MSNNHGEEHYLSIWTDVREKLLLLNELDPPIYDKPDLYRKTSRVIFGASSHNYRCDPMSEKEIQFYEKELGVSLPKNFRIYLSVCGSNSAGPGYGINVRRVSSDTIDNVKQFSPLEARSGVGYVISENEDSSDLSENEYTFEFDDLYKGTIEVSTSGNPCINYLVVNGKTQGDVFSCTGDMLFYEGSFETWYKKWLDKTFSELRSS